MTTNASTQALKGEAFRALHTAKVGFLIPNPWDAGTARLLSHLGFKALATTSAGLAFSHGKPDNSMPRDLLFKHLAELVSAVDLPVSADLENGFGSSPETVAETVRLAAGLGVVGGSIEDTTGDAQDPLISTELAADRVRAAAQVARSLPFTFTLTARAENYSVGRPDLKDVIVRLQAYQEAGADVLYAPFIFGREEIATLVRELDRPINVLTGFSGMRLSVAELLDLGVQRVSVGGSLARAAFGEFLRAATELRDQGTATYSGSAASARDLSSIFAQER